MLFERKYWPKPLPDLGLAEERSSQIVRQLINNYRVEVRLKTAIR